MTSILERTISIIAPHYCISCGNEGNILCEVCAPQVFGEAPEKCVLCNRPNFDARICTPCSSRTELQHVWVAAEYDGVVKRLVHAYKFERVRAAHAPIAAAMADALPYFDDDVVVIHIPTATIRVRQRGYDQAKLLARDIAALRGWRHVSYIRRRHNERQVGSNRAQRFMQAADAFEVRGDVVGAHVLLVDDVATSGATLVAAAALISKAGARRIDAVVAAKHTLEQS